MRDDHNDPEEREVCQEKTSKGNVFYGKRKASRAAKNVRRDSGDRVHEYYCLICHKWHIGSYESYMKNKKPKRLDEVGIIEEGEEGASNKGTLRKDTS